MHTRLIAACVLIAHTPQQETFLHNRSFIFSKELCIVIMISIFFNITNGD